MRLSSNFNLDLGLPYLIKEWKKFFTKNNLIADSAAGITVACIAIPLSLAIALASGVSPGVGLITAIIAGIVCALFGGTPLAVSGPAAAMTILIANNIEKFGVEALIFMTLIAGLMQLASGILGLGKLGKFVPLPVIAGFTAGIGVIILIGQLPRAFGLPPPEQSHIFSVITHLVQYFHKTNYVALAVVAMTLAIIIGMSKISRKIPAALTAVIVVTAITHFAGLSSVPLIGAIPSSLPAPHWPTLPNISMYNLFFNAFVIYLLASLETLLSSSAVDKLSQGEKHKPDQELIGQGLGNLAVSMFNGIPVTSVIVRSAANVRAGAKTRRASIIHSVVIFLAVYAIAPLISMIPIAALAGVLFSVAFSMINYHELRQFWVTSRAEAFIYLATLVTIVFFDLIAGVQVGILAACVIILFKLAGAHFHVSEYSEEDTLRLSFIGPLTFLSIGKLNKIDQRLKLVSPHQTVIVDLSRLSNLDSSGASTVIDLFNHCQSRGVTFYVKGLPRTFEPLFRMNGGGEILDKFYLVSESQLRTKDGVSKSFRGRLVHGVQQFYDEVVKFDRRLYEHIATQQDPHTLFITCSDSRLVPTKITSADPGELFIIRNVGNFIPPCDEKVLHSEAVALEFALNSLRIHDIVVCGHASCGAINACCNRDTHYTPQLQHWIELMRRQLTFKEGVSVDDVAKQNILNQLANLKTYPVIQRKLENQTLHLHAWYFDFEQNLVYEWNGSEFKAL